MAACCQPLLYGGGIAGAVLIKRVEPYRLDPILGMTRINRVLARSSRS